MIQSEAVAEPIQTGLDPVVAMMAEGKYSQAIMTMLLGLLVLAIATESKLHLFERLSYAVFNLKRNGKGNGKGGEEENDREKFKTHEARTLAVVEGLDGKFDDVAEGVKDLNKKAATTAEGLRSVHTRLGTLDATTQELQTTTSGLGKIVTEHETKLDPLWDEFKERAKASR